jgi:cytochrome P450
MRAMSTHALPPGSLGWPWLGEGIAFLRDIFGFFDDRFDRHGPVFKTRIFGNRVVALRGADAFELVNRDPPLTRAGASPGFLERLFDPDAIPFLGGEPHRRRRAFLRRALAPEAVDGYRPAVRAIFERYLESWVEVGEIKGVDEAGRAAFAIANAIFFGADPAVDDPLLQRTFETYNRGFASLPIALPFTRYGKALRARDRMWAHCAAAIGVYQPGSGCHALDGLVRARDAAGGEPDQRVLEIELVHALTVAQGAIKAAVVNLLRGLSANPDVLDRAREAARAGDRGYLDQVTRESRRYYKIVPMTGLGVATDEIEHAGFRIPSGWKVVAAIHSTLRDPDAFAEPDRFDPDRFAGELPAGYVAHGGGPADGHRCAGEELADMVLATFLEVVLPKHGWQLPDQDLSEKPGGFAPMPRDGFRVRFAPL